MEDFSRVWMSNSALSIGERWGSSVRKRMVDEEELEAAHLALRPAGERREQRVIIYDLKSMYFSAHSGRDGTSCLRQSFP